MIRVKGLPAGRLAAAVLLYAYRRMFHESDHLQSMLTDVDGRRVVTREEAREALVTDAALRRLGVRCLWRSAVVTEIMRRRGIASRIRISMHPRHPRRAHAEVEVGGTPLRPDRPGQVILR